MQATSNVETTTSFIESEEGAGDNPRTRKEKKGPAEVIFKVILLVAFLVINGATVTVSLGNMNKNSAEDLGQGVSAAKSVSQEVETVQLRAPFTGVIAGPTGSGKTRLVLRLIELRKELSDHAPEEVWYCYGAWQKAFLNVTDVNFREGLLDPETDIPDDGRHRWLIIDDLMEEVRNSKKMLALFTKLSHHRNISVWFLTQNFFHKDQRAITLQAQYIFLGKNPREMSQLGHLGRQLFPHKSKFLTECYEDATREPYSFLFLDLKQTTPEHLRVLGNFPPNDEQERYTVAYTPK